MTFLAASALTLGGSLGAYAAESEPPTIPKEAHATTDASDAMMPPGQVLQIIDALKDTQLAPRTSIDDRETSVSQLETTRDTSRSENFHMRAKRFAVGFENGGLYLQLNQLDQDLVLAGASAWIGTSICLIPAVGLVACISAQALTGLAIAFLAHHGKCKDGREVRILAGGGGRCM